MATLVVEDGSGLSNANSYVDVAFVDSYFDDRGIAGWTDLNNDIKVQKLIQATEYIDLRWGSVVSGRPEVSDQALEFPRTGLKDRYGNDVEGIPLNLKKAAAEYAIATNNGPLNQEQFDNAEQLKKESVNIAGAIVESKEYFVSSTSRATYKQFPKADAYIRGFVTGGSQLRAIGN